MSISGDPARAPLPQQDTRIATSPDVSPSAVLPPTHDARPPKETPSPTNQTPSVDLNKSSDTATPLTISPESPSQLRNPKPDGAKPGTVASRIESFTLKERDAQRGKLSFGHSHHPPASPHQQRSARISDRTSSDLGSVHTADDNSHRNASSPSPLNSSAEEYPTISRPVPSNPNQDSKLRRWQSHSQLQHHYDVQNLAHPQFASLNAKTQHQMPRLAEHHPTPLLDESIGLPSIHDTTTPFSHTHGYCERHGLLLKPEGEPYAMAKGLNAMFVPPSAKGRGQVDAASPWGAVGKRALDEAGDRVKSGQVKCPKCEGERGAGSGRKQESSEPVAETHDHEKAEIKHEHLEGEVDPHNYPTGDGDEHRAGKPDCHLPSPGQFDFDIPVHLHIPLVHELSACIRLLDKTIHDQKSRLREVTDQLNAARVEAAEAEEEDDNDDNEEMQEIEDVHEEQKPIYASKSELHSALQHYSFKERDDVMEEGTEREKRKGERHVHFSEEIKRDGRVDDEMRALVGMVEDAIGQWKIRT